MTTQLPLKTAQSGAVVEQDGLEPVQQPISAESAASARKQTIASQLDDRVDNSATKAIRRKCLDCSCWQEHEVRNCPVVDCPLWAWRFGIRAHTAIKLGRVDASLIPPVSKRQKRQVPA